ncbi:MAG: hypothetical protein ABIM99_05800 [Candidatus Dojkabacteria bacterium]
MAKKHQTKPGADGHQTKHSYPGQDVRRSHDRGSDGVKRNDHQVDQHTGRKLTISTGKVTNTKHEKNAKQGSIGDWFGLGGGIKK